MTTTETDRIHARSKSCLAAMNRGDIDAVMEHYTKDARLLFSGVDIIEGTAAIRDYWTSVADPDRVAELETLSIDVAGDIAYEVARYVVRSTGPDGTTEVTGKNVVVWRRDDDVWRLTVDICTAD